MTTSNKIDDYWIPVAERLPGGFDESELPVFLFWEDTKEVKEGFFVFSEVSPWHSVFFLSEIDPVSGLRGHWNYEELGHPTHWFYR